LGVQDLDYKVQKAVNRIQPLEDTLRVLNKASQLGFKSTSIDLIYGLPFQTVLGFAKTIETVIREIKPARIALFNYAHIPQLFMPQTRIKEEDLPNSADKLTILQESVESLSVAGYKFIGMDHFALPDDELAIALENGTLQRNFQGYSTFADTHMLSFGVSSIGFVGNSYYQNVKDTESYYQSLENGKLPILRGLLLNEDDVIRRFIIQQIMCQFSLDYSAIEERFNLDFKSYFANELIELSKIGELGLISIDTGGFNVSNKGRFLIRNVAMLFDKYLQQKKDFTRYSKVI
jgi:oxygen-independent coproporphyrinogen-3 oxidase